MLVEAETVEELNSLLDKLLGLSESPHEIETIPPKLPTGLGCSDAIKALLESEWGKQPHTMTEIRIAFEKNALYFSKGTLSGTLRFLDKRGDIRRFKNAGNWVYMHKEK